MGKHTQGHWFVTGSGLSRYVESRIDGGLIQEVAWCGATLDPEGMENNARLISAAPDLLEALHDVLREAVILSDDYLQAFRHLPDDAVIQGWDKARWKAALAAQKKALAAIAKATGA